MSPTKTLKPADEVSSWCGKCGEMRLHKVKAVVSGRTPKVICMTCTSEHNLKADPPGTPKKSASSGTTSTRSSTRKKAVEAVESNPWPEVTKNVSEERIRHYSIQERFVEGDVIRHNKYGLGVVSEIMDANKMSVWFEDIKRIMVYNKL